MAIQLLVGGNIICIKEKDSINKLQKMAGMCFTVVLAILNIVGGVYGPIGMIGSLLVILQLVLAVLMLIYMDQVLEKGYGVGQSAISIFTACSVCEDVIWHAFSPITANFRGVNEPEGSVVALIRGLISSFNMRTVRQSFFRNYLPNLWTMVLTILMICGILYLQSLNMIIRVTNRRGDYMNHSIRLFYTATTPIMFLTQLATSVGKVYEGLGHVFGYENFTMGALGGMIYKVFHPPASVIQEPFHFLIYSVFTVVSSTLISKAWLELSGSSSKDIARKWKEQGVIIPGHRSSNTRKELDRYIPVAAALGGFGIGVVSVAANTMGMIGSGTGLFLAITTICEIQKTIQKEGI
ncbi:hypothetical protein SELMODRAFT_419988 [Selaginella moellendorffii]|uniref:Translocon Sec61/SecY plug domain-containing protein n=1 Tax=Selaginella moellendorffii TaxID=88036 RepID=D8SA73_SELML|nr:hypothetical protein SELMODRAFT_419988 [Selaginella moellendorffii]